MRKCVFNDLVVRFARFFQPTTLSLADTVAAATAANAAAMYECLDHLHLNNNYNNNKKNWKCRCYVSSNVVALLFYQRWINFGIYFRFRASIRFPHSISTPSITFAGDAVGLSKCMTWCRHKCAAAHYCISAFKDMMRTASAHKYSLDLFTKCMLFSHRTANGFIFCLVCYFHQKMPKRQQNKNASPARNHHLCVHVFNISFFLLFGEQSSSRISSFQFEDCKHNSLIAH